MATQLNVYNLAFGHLGEAVYSALTDDPLPPNIAKANAQWAQCLDSALARSPWLCCLESRSLPEDTPPTEAGWGNPHYARRYTLPAGCLRVWSVDGLDEDAWQMGKVLDAQGAVRSVIWSNRAGPLVVQLVMRRPIEACSPLLVDAIALSLAARLAGPIQQNEQKAQRLAQAAEDAFNRADFAEASEIGGQAPILGSGALTAARRATL